MYLTKEGELLKEYTEQAFMALDTGVNKLAQLKSQHLDVSCEPTLTMRWLMPRLSDFHQLSGADVRLSTAGGPVTLGTSGLSLAIRRDDFELVHDYHKTMLVEEWVGPVCSPAYWHQAQHDVSKITLLHSQTRPMAWESWSSLSGDASLLGNTHQTFAHFYFCFQAAVDGLGAAMGSYPLVVDDLTRGNLIAPFGFVPSKHNYILLSQKSAPDALEQTFTHWLQQSLSECVPSADDRAKGLQVY